MKRLLTFLPHMPSFESCFPLLERLHQRGQVDLDCVVGGRLRQTEPRVVEAFERAGMDRTDASTIGMELFSRGRIRRADGVLTHSDPIAYGKKMRQRDGIVMRTKKPVVFVQHGMIQLGLHYTLDAKKWDYYASLMLLWNALDPDTQNVFVPGVSERMAVTGLLKTNRLPPRPANAEFAALLAGFRQKVLICHNYGFEAPNFDDTASENAFALWEQVFDARPDTLFVLRGHRGRKFPAHEARIARLVKGRANVLLSDRHSGLMRMATIQDVLVHMDRVITHPSTVVLDALGMGLPTAILDNYQPMLNNFPQITDKDGFFKFLDTGELQEPVRDFLARYGDIDANLDRAAQRVEAWIENL